MLETAMTSQTNSEGTSRKGKDDGPALPVKNDSGKQPRK
jgi:hypothetical protein